MKVHGKHTDRASRLALGAVDVKDSSRPALRDSRRRSRLLLPALFFAAALNGCGGGGGGDSATVEPPPPPPPPPPAAATVEEMRTAAIFSSHASLAMQSDPGLVADASVLSAALATAGVDVDLIVNAIRQAQAVSSSQTSLGGSQFDAIVRRFENISDELEKAQVKGGQSVVQASMIALLGDAMAGKNWKAVWQQTRAEKTDEVWNSLHLQCVRSTTSAACDSLFAGKLPYGATASFDQMCANTDPGGCSELRADTVGSKESLAATANEQFSIATKMVADCTSSSPSDACENASPEGEVDSREVLGQKVSNAVRAAAHKASYFGVDAKFIADVKASADAAGTIVKSAASIYDSVSKIHLDDLSDALRWVSIRDYILLDGEGKGKGLSDLIKIGEGVYDSVTSISGAVSTMMKLFGGDSSDTDPAVMQNVEEIKAMITELRSTLIARLDSVDSKLDTILGTLITGLSAMDSKIGDVNTQLSQISAALAQLESQISDFSLNTQAWLRDISRQQLNVITALDNPNTVESEWLNQLTVLFRYARDTASDSLHAGIHNASYAVDPAAEFAMPVGEIINSVANYPSARFSMSALAADRLSSPSELVFVLAMYWQMLEKFPTYAVRNATVVNQQVADLVSIRIQGIAGLVAAAQNIELHTKLIAEIDSKVRALQVSTDDHVPVYLRKVSPAGSDLSTSIDLWGSPNQVPGAVPAAIRSNAIAPCSGTGNIISVPANWTALFPESANAARTADALGVQALTLCWSIEGQQPGSYDQIYSWKWKSGKWYGYATGSVDIWVKSGDILVARHRLNFQQTFDQSNFQSWLCVQSGEGGINIDTGWSRYPAQDILYQGWTGGWVGSGLCSESGVQVAGLANRVSGGGATKIFDWALDAPATKALTENRVTAKLDELRHGFYVDAAAEVSGVGPIGLSARALDGVRLAAERFQETAAPNLSASDGRISYLMKGNDRIPESSSVKQLFLNTGTSANAIASRIDLVSSSTAKTSQLLQVVSDHIDRVKSGVAREGFGELDATRVRLRIAQRTANSSASSQ